MSADCSNCHLSDITANNNNRGIVVVGNNHYLKNIIAIKLSQAYSNIEI